MSHNTEHPKTVVTNDGREESTHPCFAQILASRVSGDTRLYDSDFRHNHYITVKICASQLTRDLGRDWHFGRQNYIEVALSESQWATFISSPNVGSGVPCTLKYKDGRNVPQLPEVAPNDREKFSNEFKEILENHKSMLRGISEELASTTPGKKRMAELARSLSNAVGNLTPNVDFMANQFDDHMETTVERAKQEVHGYINSTIHRAGLAAISQQNGGPLPIEY